MIPSYFASLLRQTAPASQEIRMWDAGMTNTDGAGKGGAKAVDLDDLVASSDTGARAPGGWVATMLVFMALFWSLFQIYYASPLPFSLSALTGVNFTLNDTEARSIHLALAIFLGFMAYPAFKRSRRDRIPIADWVLAIVGAVCAGYIWFMYAELAQRPGRSTDIDIAVGVIGLICLLEATRRALGPPLMIVALVFLAYVFFGDSELVPEDIRWKGASLTRAVDHMWITTEGVFGIALGVSTSFVFLFVLFGSLLDKAGAGNYFIQVAFALLGHLRGGPAKAAVVSSAMTGVISGSSIANVVTTGTFTIPLMKRVGFTGEKAGAVEVASSVNGQIMPPVMGAAAFLMVEYVGISYVEVVKHALLPAVISYIALVYIVHLEALKTGMKALPKPGAQRTFAQVIVSIVMTIILANVIFAPIVFLSALLFGVQWTAEQVDILDTPGAALCAGLIIVILTVMFWARVNAWLAGNVRVWAMSVFGIVLFCIATGFFALMDLVNILKLVFGDGTIFAAAALLIFVYLALIKYQAKVPELKMDDPNAEIVTLPEAEPTIKSGLHFLLPIVVLIWALMVERLSPGLSAFWAVMTMIFIQITQRPIKAFFRKQGDYTAAARQGLSDLFEGLVAGARNMIGIGIATATAGIVVGTVSLTGIGQVMADFVEALSMGSVVLMLIWVALLSLVLGMGLPTTANYIVVSSLMAPVVVELGADAGLIVPLIAVHMFVFYFGIMADVTPPVGLASFAAAAVSGSDPIKTGFTAFFYSLRTVALPFVFIFNPALLLIGIDSAFELISTIVISTMAILIFAAATQGYFFTRSRIYETIALLLAAFILFRPGFFWDRVFPPFEFRPGIEVTEIAGALAPGSDLPVTVTGETFEGDLVRRSVLLPLGVEGDGAARLEAAGIVLREEDGRAIVDDVVFGGPAEKLGVDFDFEIAEVKLPADRPPEQLVWIVGIMIVLGVALLQRRRKPTEAANV